MKASLILILLVVMATIPPASAEILTVSQAEGDYATIQSALNASSDGDTIQIDRGVYAETLLIGKSVSLVGAGEDTVIQPLIWIAPTLHIMADNVSIVGIRLLNGSTAIRTMWSENVSIRNCYFEGNGYGIWLGGGGGNSVVDSTFNGNNIHILLENTVFTTIHQNQLNEGTTGISMILSGFTNITENVIEKLEVGISLESSGDNLIQGNDFANCSTGVFSVISGGNRFSSNRAKATQLFLDLRLSSQNEIAENSFEGEEGIYAREKTSDNNVYLLDRFNLTGAEFEFSLFEPSVPEEYVCLGDGLNLTIVPDVLTNSGEARLDAVVSRDEIGKMNVSSVGFYSMEGDTLTCISGSEMVGDEIRANASIKDSGFYLLLGKKEGVTPGWLLPTEALIVIIAVFVAVISVGVLLAYLQRKKSD
jgi:nitrous oxidase accessory protein